jgi:serine/threonine-protein kinase/endoribonuclease IRE1
MLHLEPIERPSANAVIKHIYFWDAAKKLTFLQVINCSCILLEKYLIQFLKLFKDVSDRVESDEQGSTALSSLEHKGWIVVQRDWRKHVGEEIAADLRKYRNYRGSSVRDLLRALRNKVGF